MVWKVLKKSLHPYALDESGLSIGRVRKHDSFHEKVYSSDIKVVERYLILTPGSDLGPIMVYVLPEPVCPYAIMQTL